MGAIWRFGNETGLLYPRENEGHKGPVLGPRCIGPEKGSNPYIILFYSILFYNLAVNTGGTFLCENLVRNSKSD